MLIANILWYFFGDYMLKILNLGNDRRNLTASEVIKEKLSVCEITDFNAKKQLDLHFDLYLFPIPSCKDKIYLNSSAVNITLDELFLHIPNEAAVICAGKLRENCTDITSRDDFSYYNAVPTAEGAINLAISLTDKTLCDSRILITGFGRVSKLLAHRLFPFSKNITVAARKAGDLSLIESLGMTPITIDSLVENIGRFDIIFNTVPVRIFNQTILSAAKENSVFIELASNESGFDTKAIASLPLIYRNAPGLPVRIAPISAGKILADTVINILRENKLI